MDHLHFLVPETREKRSVKTLVFFRFMFCMTLPAVFLAILWLYFGGSMYSSLYTVSAMAGVFRLVQMGVQ